MDLLEEVTLGSVLSTDLLGVGLVIAAPLIRPAVGHW